MPKPAPTASAAEPPLTALLTVKQVAAYFQVSERTVRRWMASGLLKAVKVGPRQVRIRRAELERVQRSVRSA